MTGFPQGTTYRDVGLKGLTWADSQNRLAAQHTYSLMKKRAVNNVHANSTSMKSHLSYDGKVECSFSPFTLQEDQEHRAPCPLQKHRAEGST